MRLSNLLGTHTLPLWFLVLSLFLPRLCLLLAWFEHTVPAYIPSTVGIIQIVVALVVPRILILFLIYQDQGVDLWFLIHAVGLVIAWGGGGTSVARRRRTVDVSD